MCLAGAAQPFSVPEPFLKTHFGKISLYSASLSFEFHVLTKLRCQGAIFC
jgi:hypothetical protein